MKTTTYTECRANFASMLDAVIDDSEELVIRRGSKPPVVVVPLSEWSNLQEHLHLFSSPANSRRLYEALDQSRSGRSVERPLIEAHDE